MLKSRYIKINRIYKKLSQAENEHLSIYVHAPSGYGKTVAVQYYYRNEPVFWLSGKEEYLKHMPEPNRISERTIIVDDISWLTDSGSIAYVCRLLELSSHHVVLIGRNRMPQWLRKYFVFGDLITADKKMFTMTKDEIETMMAQRDCFPDEDEKRKKIAGQVEEDVHGYPLAAACMVEMIAERNGYDKETYDEALTLCFRALESEVFEKWPRTFQNFLMSLADFDTFDRELAEIVTLESDTDEMIEYAIRVDDMIHEKENGMYEMDPIIHYYLLWNRSKLWSREQEIEVWQRAESYYQRKDKISEALYFAAKEENRRRLQELLIRNSEKNPSTAKFFENRNYYRLLTGEEIKSSPALMCGMSMLESILRNPKQSNRWRDQLREYYKTEKLTAQERKEVRSLLAYLSIALPQNGVADIVETVKNIAGLIGSREINRMVFSITSNLPSLMNGGKDFSEWTKKDKILAEELEVPGKLVLGDYAEGLTEIALAESALEKQSEESYDIISRVQEGISNAKRAGKPEIEFAGIGVLLRLHVSHGKIKLAHQLLDDFERKMLRQGNEQFEANIETLRVWIALLRNDQEHVKRWVENTSDEDEDYNILRRFEFMMRLRALIMLHRYEEAWALSERLEKYFTMYQRVYMEMENQILQAVILYRTGRRTWKSVFQKALERAEEYHFVWLVAKEGNAVVELYRKCDFPDDDGFYRQAYEKAKKIADMYPSYLTVDAEDVLPLTKTEVQILKMHCEGRTTGEILDKMNITQRTLKFHNSNIYKKMRVKNKREAVEKAQRLQM